MLTIKIIIFHKNLGIILLPFNFNSADCSYIFPTVKEYRLLIIDIIESIKKLEVDNDRVRIYTFIVYHNKLAIKQFTNWQISNG